MARLMGHDRWDYIPEGQEILDAKSSLVLGPQAGKMTMGFGNPACGEPELLSR